MGPRDIWEGRAPSSGNAALTATFSSLICKRSTIRRLGVVRIIHWRGPSWMISLIHNIMTQIHIRIPWLLPVWVKDVLSSDWSQDPQNRHGYADVPTLISKRLIKHSARRHSGRRCSLPGTTIKTHVHLLAYCHFSLASTHSEFTVVRRQKISKLQATWSKRQLSARLISWLLPDRMHSVLPSKHLLLQRHIGHPPARKFSGHSPWLLPLNVNIYRKLPNLFIPRHFCHAPKIRSLILLSIYVLPSLILYCVVVSLQYCSASF